MSTHFLMLTAEINQNTCNVFTAYLVDLLASGATKLTIAISSPGGNVVNGITMYNTIKSMPYEINTHNISNVDSIANVIFLAGEHRVASPTSTFMFHGVGFNGNASERLEEKNILEKLDIIRSDHRRIATIISDHSTLTFDACMELFKQQETRDASWALKNGLANEIGEFTIAGGTVKYLI